MCEDNEEGDDTSSDEAVCATNGITYPGLCRMCQETGANEGVAHAGACNQEDCNSGPVSTVYGDQQYCIPIVVLHVHMLVDMTASDVRVYVCVCVYV